MTTVYVLFSPCSGRRTQSGLAGRLLAHAAKQALGVPCRLIREPAQAPRIAGSDLACSLSHTEGAVCAMVSGSACGIDIEKLRTPRLGAARRLFTENELRACPQRFWEIWTSKEALGKAQGTGLTLSLKDEDTLTGPAARLLRTAVFGDYVLSVCCADDVRLELLPERSLDAVFI